MISLVLFACIETGDYVNPLSVDDDGDGYSEFGGDQNDANPEYVNDLACPDVHLTCPEPIINLTCPAVTVDSIVCPAIPSCPELPEIPTCPEPVECPDVNVECPSAPSNSGPLTEVREYYSLTWTSGNNMNNPNTWVNTDDRTFIITSILGSSYCRIVPTSGPNIHSSILNNSYGTVAYASYEIPVLSGDQIGLAGQGSTSVTCMFAGYWLSYE